MKFFYWLLAICISAGTICAQSAADAAVQISVSVQNQNPAITLSWVGNTSTTQYVIHKKLKSALSWGTAVATLPGTTNQFTDNNVVAGVSYEYRVLRSGSGYSGYGYVNAGIEVPPMEYRGKLVLVIDSSIVPSLLPEIKRLVNDIEGDGWDVIRMEVSRNASVKHVKHKILTAYRTDSANTKAVFLLGHVPVPYSGFINPDGHPDHYGAWPADMYYGDMNGNWTDAVGPATSTASPARTTNQPGDGKFDQSIVTGEVELQVGRVDLRGMTSFTLTEMQLLKNYLDKDHAYRKHIYVPTKAAVIDDNFGYFSGEAFAASGYKNFGPLVGPSNITSADYFTTMSSTSCQWSYGCGGGYYNSASGIGNTANFAASSLDGVFTMLFGSYFGDWDTTDAFLRAPLAQGKMLTSIWSGRPHYQLHHMALGENIGYSVRLTQNNTNALYYSGPTSITGLWVHTALMGDPTLRNDAVGPVSNVVATKSGYHCNITWSASQDAGILGYNVYMKNDSNNVYTRVNKKIISGVSFTDSCLIYQGVYHYMVRAVKLENTPSGTYYNLSEGVADTAWNSNSLSNLAAFTYTVFGDKVQFSPTTTLSASFHWEFGDGGNSNQQSPLYTYMMNADFNVMLIATGDCNTDTAYATISVAEVGLSKNEIQNIKIFPNPTHGIISIETTTPIRAIDILSIDGKLLIHKERVSSIDLTDLAAGLYLMRVDLNGPACIKPVVLQN